MWLLAHTANVRINCGAWACLRTGILLLSCGWCHPDLPSAVVEHNTTPFRFRDLYCYYAETRHSSMASFRTQTCVCSCWPIKHGTCQLYALPNWKEGLSLSIIVRKFASKSNMTLPPCTLCATGRKWACPWACLCVNLLANQTWPYHPALFALQEGNGRVFAGTCSWVVPTLWAFQSCPPLFSRYRCADWVDAI